MERFLVLTVIGEDKPGLVESLARTIAGHDGNWLESRMVHLAGKFAGVLRVSVPPPRMNSLMQALEGLTEALALPALDHRPAGPRRHRPE